MAVVSGSPMPTKLRSAIRHSCNFNLPLAFRMFLLPIDRLALHALRPDGFVKL